MESGSGPCVLEEEYTNIISLFRDVMKKLNPIQCVMGDDLMKNLVCSTADLLQLTDEEKISIKKKL